MCIDLDRYLEVFEEESERGVLARHHRLVEVQVVDEHLLLHGRTVQRDQALDLPAIHRAGKRGSESLSMCMVVRSFLIPSTERSQTSWRQCVYVGREG